MAAEQFNDTFWVAIAAAAPVIGLASVVAADQLMRALVPALTGGQRKGAGGRSALSAFLFSYLNWLLQAAALLAALLSLSYHSDALPKGLIIAMEVLGMFLVMMPTVMNIVHTSAVMRRLRREH